MSAIFLFNYPVIQIQLFLFWNVIFYSYLIYFKPFNTVWYNRFEYFNEFNLYIATNLLPILTDLISDDSMKVMAGWLIIGIILLLQKDLQDIQAKEVTEAEIESLSC